MPKFHERLRNRIEVFETPTPAMFRLAADIVAICAKEANAWTRRYDDAVRIPDVLIEARNALFALADAALQSDTATEDLSVGNHKEE